MPNDKPLGTLIQQALALRSKAADTVIPEARSVGVGVWVVKFRKYKRELEAAQAAWGQVSEHLLGEGFPQSEIYRLAKAVKDLVRDLELALSLSDQRDADAADAFVIVAASILLRRDTVAHVTTALGATEPGLYRDQSDRDEEYVSTVRHRTVSESDLIDVLDANGQSTVH